MVPKNNPRSSSHLPAIIFITSSSTVLPPPILSHVTSLGHSLTNNPDLYFVDQKTGWGIDQIRALKGFLTNKPLSHSSKLVIITHAHLLSLEAQNSLLKTLEEPPVHSHLILTTPQPSLLLPTILSRCQITRIPSAPPLSASPISIKPTIADNLLESDRLSADKTTVLPALQANIVHQHQLLVHQPSPRHLQLLQGLIKATSMIRANVDPRSALDYFFLSNA